MSAETFQLLGLCAGGSSFAADVMALREILRASRLTPVPEAPPILAGILNVRGELVPVLDLARVLGLDPAEGEAAARRILLLHHGSQTFGLLADAVEEVISVPLNALEPVALTPAAGAVAAMFRRVTADGRESVALLLHTGVLARLARGERADGTP